MSSKVISFQCLKVSQPIGVFYVGVMNSKDLYKISWADVRRIKNEKRDIEKYLGIQRELSTRRVKQIASYVGTSDACFPTGVILAVKGENARYNEVSKKLELFHDISGDEKEDFNKLGKIAKILDGQHRIAGLKDFRERTFEVNVSIFIDMDIEDQAYLFSTVNFTQTKVNRSLVYDLFEYAKSRSPQKLCHDIAVILDSNDGSPFYKKIKRLGLATGGRFDETITQATFARSLIGYLSEEPLKDRDNYKRKKSLKKVDEPKNKKLIFRNMMIDKKDVEITDVLWNYFSAVNKRWPEAWTATGHGYMLNKTNGFKALMRFLKHAYLYETSPGGVPTTSKFLKIFKKIDLKDADFTIERYVPGGAGESKLYKDLLSKSKIPS